MSRTFTRAFTTITQLFSPTRTRTMSLLPDNPSILSTLSPLAGCYRPHQLQALFYGPDCVKDHLLSSLPTKTSKAYIITGKSLSKTPLIKQVEDLLGSAHAGTVSDIKQHAHVAELDKAAETVHNDSSVDTLISIGGGSPIDSAKVISNRFHENHGKWLHHIAIPTTLSAAECTAIGGYTTAEGVKTAVMNFQLFPVVVFYDPTFALHTPSRLFLATGLRAVDHAVESQYHPTATEMPCRLIARGAAQELFENLPKYKANPKDQDVITRLFLAAYASLGFLGRNMKGGLGLSHSLGYALGSPYDIPHGETSCLTLGHVAKLKASTDEAAAANLARMLPSLGGTRTGDDRKDGAEVGERILALVKELGLKTTLTEKGVGKDQVGIIVQRATGGLKEGDLFEKVKGLVEGLY